jgi:tetratricopeptide (TPR) repeat protein
MLLTGALAAAGRWDDVDREVAKRLEKDPDNEQILQTVASLEMQRGRYQQVRERIRHLLERGRATSGDLNNYAWSALLDDTLDQEAIDAAERAARQTQSSDSGILHTLAAVYAADERPVEARELILHVMDLEGAVEPGANEWYVLGLIAEAYGEVDAARTMYERVERPKSETAVPVSSYFLAQQRLKALAE